MSISTKTQHKLDVALGSKDAGAEVGAALNRIAADVATVSTANATDLASAEALANANKAAINAILAALKAAGLMS
jgi:hypothetical protein